ncbi:sarcosine oxidase subunit alpha [Rhizobiales bacterium GAS188]|nr:sarcosine oxidase subunit alpha [Rhizobiales bacterium GAS188]
MSGFRLPAGGRIDRERSLSFRFDGRSYLGHPGDTLAAALLASGVRLFGRSFKYHRPRGVITAGPEEPAALVELRTGARREPNTPATMIELFDGLEAQSQNRWPSLAFDLGAINGLLSPFIPAGFYYKTFMWPASFWEKFYEPAIRRAAGLGRGAEQTDPDRYDIVHDHCDVLVVGSGPAGLAAARAAVEAGARVILAEQDFELGGGTLLELSLATWRDETLAALRAGEAALLPRTAVVGAYDHGVFAAVERLADDLPEPMEHSPRQRLHVIRAAAAVFATGAVERHLAFPDNDRPGVMLAGAVRSYLHRHGVAAGRRVVLFTNNDAAYLTAFDLHEAGVAVAAIVDVRSDSIAGRAAKAKGLEVLFGHEVAGTSGKPDLDGVLMRKRGEARSRRVLADVLAISGGEAPSIQLPSQARLPILFDERIGAFVSGSTDRLLAAGSARGLSGIREAARDGEEAGRRAAEAAGFDGRGALPLPDLPELAATALAPFFEVKSKGKAFVDLQNDVTAEDIRLARREGYSHIEHAKRYTTHSMATDQGKIGGLLGSAILAEARGEPLAEVGLPTFRPYAMPVAWGALAGDEVGRRFKPKRLLPLHDWHEKNSAVFVTIGLWMRPLVYSPSRDTSWGPVLEEVRAVRRSVGITDMSSLGKIDVQGPGAASFLDRIYANTFSTLKIGRARYGIMLREDGILLDDGTTSRLGADHFLVTTTTQKAAEVLEHMEWHLQTVWPELDVTLTDVGDQWAQFAVAGPKARLVLEQVVADLDLGNDAFPFMAAGSAVIAGVPGRIFRISFSGELAYEVAVPAGFAEHVWSAILAAGSAFGITPYALDALNVMRIEKGHVTGGEINGQTTPADLGFGRMLKKGDHVGKVLGARPGLADADRLQLVGIRCADATARLRGGAHLVDRDATSVSQGFLTAACMSAELDRWIGLALLRGGHGRHGQRLIAASPIYDEQVEVEVMSPHFVDPKNIRVHA